MPESQISLATTQGEILKSIEEVCWLVGVEHIEPPWWQILLLVRKLEAQRANHLRKLYKCSSESQDIHWVVLSIMQVAIIRHVEADEELLMIKSTLHKILCLNAGFRVEVCSEHLTGRLTTYSKRLVEIAGLEKTSVLKMLEILDNYRAVAVSVYS